MTGRTVELSEVQAKAVVNALHDYRMETDRYLRDVTFRPCHPDCPHCLPRVQHSVESRVGLEQRREAIVGALTAFDQGPCDCGLRKGEHWKGDHK